ncbi:hypothetical protein DICPUDRAFT_148102 [Dictyostelium purpureum]|uniref:EGF-like domain-containing protein n=1 Tax=Dictyostelium purpureum TaxID=5786 RepID=F0ZA92_DICPU|nr:uncharacterized protein DICPUDRAFT_148102 [Dictyostelium purpureum]EGC39162.1 hypothetical protein DICPUDRAFT_148102 [Dictyostelium purpureum]|eukprot:XP_003284308.1 hypothetical protein DICPUDRAFT_148102 [Dictyostelium purpureum]
MMLNSKNKYLLLFTILCFSVTNYNLVLSQSFFPSSYNQVTSSNGFKTTSSSSTFILNGYSCDFNGDGYDDLINLVSTGIYVFYGPLPKYFTYPAQISSLNGTNGFFISIPVLPYEPICGDFNNDGFDEIVFATLQAQRGRVNVIYGTDQPMPATFSTIDGNNGFIINPLDGGTKEMLGYNTGAGDINGDGLTDLFFSTSVKAYSGTNPSLFVIYGIDGGKFPVDSSFAFDLTTLDGANGFAIKGLDSRFCLVSDFNNDGIDDIFVGDYFYIIFGSKLGFPANYVPVLDGNKGFQFIVDGNLNSGLAIGDSGDFNGDSLIDFIITTRNLAGNYVSYMAFGRLEYPPIVYLNTSIDGTDGLAVVDNLNYLSNHNDWCFPKLKDINGDGFDDIVCGGPVTRIIFGNKFKYNSGILYSDSVISSNACSGAQISNIQDKTVSIGDYNGDGLDDIVSSGTTILYGLKYIGSITFNNLVLPFNKQSNIYAIFKNNFNSNISLCEITLVKLNIKDPQSGDKFIVNYSNINNLYFSVNFINDTSIRIELNSLGSGKTLSSILDEISVSLSQESMQNNRTITKTVGNHIESLVILGVKVINCTADCLNEGKCDTLTGTCNCMKGFEGTDCSGISCSSQCLNGGSCNTTIGECICNNGFEGTDCGIALCSLTCLNGGSCNTTIGKCICSNGFEGTDCSGISCSSECLNGGSCNTTIGKCICTNDSTSNDCSKKKNKTNVGVIVGPIVGGLAFLAAIIVTIFLVKRKRISKKSQKPTELKPQASTAAIFSGGTIQILDKF